MNSPQYRVFVCTKQRPANDPEGCCCNAGASEIYQAFQAEVQKRQLGDRIEVGLNPTNRSRFVILAL